MSGGIDSRATSAAFSKPPARPVSRLMTAHTPIGSRQSCHAMPKSTAARPIIAPTDRSMPPVTITGVSAIASRPSSTPSRLISMKLATVAKFGAIAANSAISTATASSRMNSFVRRKRFTTPHLRRPCGARAGRVAHRQRRRRG